MNVSTKQFCRCYQLSNRINCVKFRQKLSTWVSFSGTFWHGMTLKTLQCFMVTRSWSIFITRLAASALFYVLLLVHIHTPIFINYIFIYIIFIYTINILMKYNSYLKWCNLLIGVDGKVLHLVQKVPNLKTTSGTPPPTSTNTNSSRQNESLPGQADFIEFIGRTASFGNIHICLETMHVRGYVYIFMLLPNTCVNFVFKNIFVRIMAQNLIINNIWFPLLIEYFS